MESKIKYRVQMQGDYIGYSKEGSLKFIQKEKVKDSTFTEQQKKYHTIVNDLNATWLLA